eukprot:gene18286-20111_t
MLNTSTVNNTAITTVLQVTTQANIPEIFPSFVEAILNFFYVVVSLIGIVGNSLIIYLIATKKVNRTAFNILLTNLSVADLIASISLYPYVFISLKGHDVSNVVGTIFCDFTVGLALFFICASVSLLSLTIISINRFICINYPLKFVWHQGVTSSKILVVASWFIAVCSILPVLASFKYNKDWGICEREWPEIIDGQLYSIITTILGFGVPVTVLFYTFIVTLKNMRIKVNDLQLSHQLNRRSRKKTIRLLGWLIIVFCACWAPFWIYWILSRSTRIFDEGNLGDYQRMRAIRFTVLIASINSSADPFLYGLFGEQFKGALRMLFRSTRIRQRYSSSRKTTMATLPVVTEGTRHHIAKEPSSYSLKELDEEVTGSLTPRSSFFVSATILQNVQPIYGLEHWQIHDQWQQ